MVISRALYDKRISQEVDGEALGDEFAGYVSAAARNCSVFCYPFLVDTSGWYVHVPGTLGDTSFEYMRYAVFLVATLYWCWRVGPCLFTR